MHKTLAVILLVSAVLGVLYAGGRWAANEIYQNGWDDCRDSTLKVPAKIIYRDRDDSVSAPIIFPDPKIETRRVPRGRLYSAGLETQPTLPESVNVAVLTYPWDTTVTISSIIEINGERRERLRQVRLFGTFVKDPDRPYFRNVSAVFEGGTESYDYQATEIHTPTPYRPTFDGLFVEGGFSAAWSGGQKIKVHGAVGLTFQPGSFQVDLMPVYRDNIYDQWQAQARAKYYVWR